MATAGNSIRVEMGKGTIVGGNVAATNMIIAKSIGSPMGTVTAVQIGVPPELYQQHRDMAKELKEKQENFAKLEQSIVFLTSRAKEGALDASKKIMLSKLNLSKEPMEDELHKLKKDFKMLSERLSGAQDGVIKVTDAVYPGVKVTLGSIIKYIDDTRRGVTIRKLDGDLSIS